MKNVFSFHFFENIVLGSCLAFLAFSLSLNRHPRVFSLVLALPVVHNKNNFESLLVPSRPEMLCGRKEGGEEGQEGQ